MPDAEWKKQRTPREIASEQKREKIYQCAVELFREYGYDAITVKDIAAKCSMSEGSIYNFFGTKYGILSGIRARIERETASLIAPTEEHLAHPVDAVLAYLLAQGRFFEELGVELTSKYYMNVPVTPDQIHSSGTLMISHRLERLRSFLTLSLETGRASSEMSADELSALFLTVCNGLLSTWIFFSGAYSLEEVSETTLRTIVTTYYHDATAK